MAEFILKDWYGKEKTFDHDTIYVRDTDGNLIPFKQEASSKVIILNEQEFDGFVYDSNFGYARMLLSSPFELVIGKQYTVAWDGVEYTCTAYDASVVLEGAVYIGNGSAFSQPSNGEPFAILCVNGACVFSGISDPAESHTIGIYQKTSGGSSADVRYVTFMSYDGLIEYGKKAVAVGDDCADPIARGVFATPTRESDVQYNYTFYGWATTPNGGADANALKAVTEDKTVYANFASTVRKYTITYYDADGTTVLKTESLAYGATPSYKPTKENVTFAEWQPSITAVTGDATYTAVWEEKVTFATASWSKISEIVDAGNAGDYFALGDTRTETLTYSDGKTETVTFEIVDMNAASTGLLDSESYGTLALLATHVLDESVIYNTSYGSSLYYSYSSILTHLRSLVGFLPVEMQSALKEVSTASDAFSNSKLHIPNTFFLFKRDADNGISGRQATAFASGKTAVCKNRSGTAVSYWLSNCKATSSKRYPTYVGTTGSFTHTTTSSQKYYVRLLCFV